jgi:hypothetical protein
MIALSPSRSYSQQPLTRTNNTYQYRHHQRRLRRCATPALVSPYWVHRLSPIDLLTELQPNSAGAVIIHPPADIGKGTSDKAVCVDEQVHALTDLSIEVARVLKPGGVCLALGEPGVMTAWGVALLRAELAFLGELAVIWDRPTLRRPHALANLPSLFTTVRRYVKPGHRGPFNPRNAYEARSNVLVCQPSHETGPTQLPVELFNYLVSVFTDENDIVVDPWCRSGSSLVAAELNEREWIGADPILDNCKVARSRVWTAEMEMLNPIGYWCDGKIEYIEG